MTEEMYQRIEQTKAYLYDYLKQSPFFEKHPAKLDYRYQHSLRTAAIAKEIGEADGLDTEALILGCLLHDISYCREFADNDDWLNHGRESAKLARPWLLQLGMEPEQVEEICYGIAIHVDWESDFEHEHTVLTDLIKDCDDIDRYDSYRIYEVLENVGFSRMHYAEQLAWLEERLPVMEEYTQYELSSPTATRLWQEKAQAQLTFHGNLYRQLKRQI